MSEHIESRLKTLAMVGVFVLFVIYVPLRIDGSEGPMVSPWMVPLRYAGAVFIAVGFAGYAASILAFFSTAEASPMLGDSRALIASGIFRYTRNPIYVSIWLILWGEALFFASVKLFYYLLFWIVFFQIVVRFLEEPYLRVTFGEEYVRYCNTVPRWIPGWFRRKGKRT